MVILVLPRGGDFDPVLGIIGLTDQQESCDGFGDFARIAGVVSFPCAFTFDMFVYHPIGIQYMAGQIYGWPLYYI